MPTAASRRWRHATPRCWPGWRSRVRPRARAWPRLLWPDKDADAARNDLRQRLFRLRKELGLDLVQGNATLGLAERCRPTTSRTPTRCSARPPVEEIAAASSRTWLEQQRARRRDRVRRSLVELCRDGRGGQGLGRRAEPRTRAAARSSRCPKHAHRRVMRLHYLAGDRAGGAARLRSLRTMLKDEVGATPSAETLALLATISAARSPLLPAAAQTVPASVLLPPRLIGRDARAGRIAPGSGSWARWSR